jgi:hypothetical protein
MDANVKGFDSNSLDDAVCVENHPTDPIFEAMACGLWMWRSEAMIAGILMGYLQAISFLNLSHITRPKLLHM